MITFKVVIHKKIENSRSEGFQESRTGHHLRGLRGIPWGPAGRRAAKGADALGPYFRKIRKNEMGTLYQRGLQKPG